MMMNRRHWTALALVGGLLAPATAAAQGEVELTFLGRLSYSDRFPVSSLSLSADGSRLAAVTRHSALGVKQWNLEELGELAQPELPERTDQVFLAPDGESFAVLLDLNVMALGAGDQGEEEGGYLFREGDLAPLADSGGLSTLSWAPDGTWLAGCAEDGVYSWQVGRRAGGYRMVEIRQPAMARVPGDGTLVVLDSTLSLVRYDLESGEELSRDASGLGPGDRYQIDPTGLLAAAAIDSEVHLVDLSSGARLYPPVDAAAEVTALALSADRSTLAIGTRIGEILIYELGGLPAAVLADPRPPRGEDPTEQPVSGLPGEGAILDLPAINAQLEVRARVQPRFAGDPRDGSSVAAALINRQGQKIRRCFHRHLRRRDPVDGSQLWTFEVNPNGEAGAAARPQRDDFGTPELDACLVTSFREPTFGMGTGYASLELELTVTAEEP